MFGRIKLFTYLYVGGSLMFAAQIIQWPIAQLVEQLTVNQPVPGSSPGGPAQ